MEVTLARPRSVAGTGDDPFEVIDPEPEAAVRPEPDRAERAGLDVAADRGRVDAEELRGLPDPDQPSSRPISEGLVAPMWPLPDVSPDAVLEPDLPPLVPPRLDLPPASAP